MTRTKGKNPRRRAEVVRLEDLAPRKEILGGSGKAVFGQATPTPAGSGDRVLTRSSDHGSAGDPHEPGRPLVTSDLTCPAPEHPQSGRARKR